MPTIKIIKATSGANTLPNAASAIAGAAAYGAFQAIETGDTTAYKALGLGALGGVGVYSTVGGMGLGIS